RRETERRFTRRPQQQADGDRREREALDQQSHRRRHWRALANDGVDRPGAAQRQRRPRRRAKRDALHHHAKQRERERNHLRRGNPLAVEQNADRDRHQRRQEVSERRFDHALMQHEIDVKPPVYENEERRKRERAEHARRQRRRDLTPTQAPAAHDEDGDERRRRRP